MSVPPLTPSPDAAPDPVFAEMLRVARALLAMRDPLDAELVVSRMLGAWWGQRIPGMSGADLERHLTEGLIAHAAASGTPAGLALLSGIASLGASAHRRELAEQGVLALADRGDLRRPAWAEAVGRVRPLGAYLSGDRFGDADEVICTFRYDSDPGGPERPGHALIAVIDHNCGGVLRDAWVTTKVDRLLEHCRAEAEENPMAVFHTLAPARARTLLERALAGTDLVVSGAPGERPARLTAAREADLVGGSLGAHHALLRSRVRALPAEARPTAEPVWRRDARATLAARFLASDEAAELSDSYAASRCVDHVIGYGCDVDAGRPMRVSPRKVETFLLTWLPRRVVLLPEESEAMPHVLGAWIRWAGPRAGLPEPAVGAALDALWESFEAFARTYRDPAEALGLGRREIRRLLPDGDLAALPRRMFAFPLLAGDLLDRAEGEFDPTTPEGRRALLRLDHFGEIDVPEGPPGRHAVDGGRSGRVGRASSAQADLDAHERLAVRLWHGDPPELWAAAQRLLDKGKSRPEVLLTLLDALADGGDEDGGLLLARLRALG